MGYNTSFAHIIPINYCQHPNLYIKKLSYLLASLLIKKESDLQLLMNNTIIKDLQSDNVFIVMVALTMIRYFLNVNNVGELFIPVVIKLIKHKMAVVRKKAILVLNNFHETDEKALPAHG